VNITVEAGNAKTFSRSGIVAHIIHLRNCEEKFNPYFQKYIFIINLDINVPCPLAAIYFFLHIFLLILFLTRGSVRK